jgi:SNF family Na+-dependent transporter
MYFSDAILVACINCGTSFFAGFAVFSVLGFMSHQLNTDIATVATSGMKQWY